MKLVREEAFAEKSRSANASFNIQGIVSYATCRDALSLETEGNAVDFMARLSCSECLARLLEPKERDWSAGTIDILILTLPYHTRAKSLSMASIIFFLLLALSFTASAQRQTNITLGSSLTPITNSSWLSPSGLYAFGFFRQRDGYSIGVFLSGISLQTVVWAARRDDAPVPSNATLLFTRNGRVVLTSAQGDTATYAYFASGTNGDDVTLNLDPDGRLYLLNSTGFNIKNIADGGYPTKETINIMKLDADGIFRLYSQNLTLNGNWSAVWYSTRDKCQPKGSCGLNGYCVVKDQEAECICLPGFKFVTQGNWTSGCERDFDAESCKDKNGSSAYTMEELSNIVWEDVSYSVLSSTTKDNCKQACLEDCNCEAALFTDGQYCRKQRFPLIFGRRNIESSNLAVVKVGRPISTMDRKEPITEKKNLGTGRTILIISGSFVAFGLAMVAIFGIIVYRYHVLSYKRVPNNDGTALNEMGNAILKSQQILAICSSELQQLVLRILHF
ncbi:hypothetical protein D5086_010040 [Populus alba]|uniref:Uncharacterized protein n=1 Tax=Populus alba TaxID=43335 RepID=A0ACC4C9K5_POPAL